MTIASNWSQLREAARAAYDEDRRSLEFDAMVAGRLLERETPTLTGAFVGSPGVLARVLTTSGAAAARELALLRAEALPRLLERGDEPPQTAPASTVDALTYVALMRCLDLELPEAAAGVEARWLRVIAPRPDLLLDSDVRTAALAAVAVGELDLVPPLAGGGPLVPRDEPRQVAGPDLKGLARHLAEVLAGGGAGDGVERPWRVFLEMFPLTLATDGARWDDLIWAAIAVMTRFEGRPVSEVGVWLPAFLAELE